MCVSVALPSSLGSCAYVSAPKCETVFYHQAGDDDDEDGEEEDEGVESFPGPHVVPLLALQDVLLQETGRKTLCP